MSLVKLVTLPQTQLYRKLTTHTETFFIYCNQRVEDYT